MEIWNNSLAKSVKKEELQGPDATIEGFTETHSHVRDDAKESDIMVELEGLRDLEEAESLEEEGYVYGEFNWDFMSWDGFPNSEEGDGHQKIENSRKSFQADCHFSIKQEEHTFLEDDEEKPYLNLSLNYQEVLEAWSNRTLWADDGSLLSANNSYMREVPVMEEERRRREASVLRYKEKRQSRLFSKKIRYQVRKLNADKRPRLKGRFVKRVPEKILK